MKTEIWNTKLVSQNEHIVCAQPRILQLGLQQYLVIDSIFLCCCLYTPTWLNF